jgi:hypothetical protein
MYKRIRGALRRFVCQITTPADAEFNVDATWLHEDGVDMPSPEEFGRRMALTILDLAGLAAEADDAMGALSATIGLVQHVEGSRKSLQRNG